MLSIEGPTPFVLTLQSVPPFFVESMLALALVVLLAVPLIAHIQLLLDNSRSSKMVVTRRKDDSKNHRHHSTRPIVMHYPVPYKVHKNSNSDLNVELTSMRKSVSTPVIKRSLESLGKKGSKENVLFVCQGFENRKQAVEKASPKTACLSLSRSSPFVATNAQLPIVDISAFDYDAYRHKLIESSLKRQYGDRQAPGNVVLNSIHLNSIGSQTGIELSERYSHSLFDFIEEYYDATTPLSKKEKEYLHPLDHFLVKGIVRPSTADRATDTKRSAPKFDQVTESVVVDEQSAIPVQRGNFEKRKVEESTINPSKITTRSRRSFSLPRSSSRTSNVAKSQIPTTVLKTPVDPITKQLFNRDETILDRVSSKIVDAPALRASRSRTPRKSDDNVLQKTSVGLRMRASSVNQGKSSAESLAQGNPKVGGYPETPSTDHEQMESATGLCMTPSEAGSISSSRPRDKSTLRTRASSLSSRNRKTEQIPNQTKQWYVGCNTNSSFNTKYHETRDTTVKIPKPKTVTRLRSTDDRFDWDVPDVPSWQDEKALDLESKKSSVLEMRKQKTVYPVQKRRRTPEMGKLSDTVLPVVESIVDLHANVSCDDHINCSTDNEPGTFSGKLKKPSNFRQRDSKDFVRMSEKKLSSASFVKPSTRPAELEGNESNGRKNIYKDRSVKLESNNGEQSSKIKTTSKSLGSTSKLPVHVNSDKSVMRAMMSSPRGLEHFDSQGKLLGESCGPVNKSSGLFGRKTRPRTAGCLQSHTASLSPKIELSLETLQPEKVATASSSVNKKLKNARPVEHENNASNVPQGLPTIGSQSVTPVSRTSGNKILKVSCPISEKVSNISQQDVAEEPIGKKLFLRARSGKYGAPKITAIQQPKKNPMADVSSSGKTTSNNPGFREVDLLKLPTEGSKAALVMRRELKTYIKKIKLILSARDKSLQAKDLASLTITEALIPELRVHLSPREVQELRSLLDRVEKQQGNMLMKSPNLPINL